MMGWLDVLLRRARIRGVQEGKVQMARTEATEFDARDDVERWQDYGFAGNPKDGQGMVINAGGHTIVLRLDRVADRPQLGEYEVAVWHKDGHMVRLRAGRVVQVDCDQLVINASAGVEINSPAVMVSGNVTAAAVAAVTVVATTSLVVTDKEMAGHQHGGVQGGTDTSGAPV